MFIRRSGVLAIKASTSGCLSQLRSSSPKRAQGLLPVSTPVRFSSSDSNLKAYDGTTALIPSTHCKYYSTIQAAKAAQYSPAVGNSKDEFMADDLSNLFKKKALLAQLIVEQGEGAKIVGPRSSFYMRACEHAISSGNLMPSNESVFLNGRPSDKVDSVNERVQVAPHFKYGYYNTLVVYRLSLNIIEEFQDLVVAHGVACKLQCVQNQIGQEVLTGAGGAYQYFIQDDEEKFSKAIRESAVCVFTHKAEESYRREVKNGVLGNKIV